MTSASARMESPSPITVPVPLGDRAYEILVGRGLIESAGAQIGVGREREDRRLLHLAVPVIRHDRVERRRHCGARRLAHFARGVRDAVGGVRGAARRWPWRRRSFARR